MEGALRDSKRNPVETAQVLLSFVRVELPAGGAEAETRFFKLFMLLCDRVFGPVQDGKAGYRHEQHSGWLSLSKKWDRRPSVVPSSQHAARNMRSHLPQTIDSDPVVKLLGAVLQPATSHNFSPSLIETISKELDRRQVLFPFPFLALPKTTQERLLAVLNATLSGNVSAVSPAAAYSENAHRLFAAMLRVRPDERSELRMYQHQRAQKNEQKRSLQLSPGIPSPVAPKPFFPQTTKQKEASPIVKLSMLEYYLFLFLRYPLYISGVTYTSSIQWKPSEKHYGEMVYCHLFKQYLSFFIAYPRSHVDGAPWNDPIASSELFLRITIDLWLEGPFVLTPTTKAIKTIEEKFLRRNGRMGLPDLNLNKSYDFAQGSYQDHPPIVQHCLSALIKHAIMDPSLPFCVGNQNESESWCLTPTMTALQQPFYNFVRICLRHASIHLRGSPFFSTLDMWLMWLEPWNVSHPNKRDFSPKSATNVIISSVSRQKKTGPTMVIPTPNQKSKYNSNWEPYLAANLYMYLVPLAIFVQRARELDFSPRQFTRSISIVKRVFRVFSPDVVNALTKLLRMRNDTTHWYGEIARNHVQNLGDYAPYGEAEISLTSCQEDMRGLLEEITMQHLKKTRNLGMLDRVFTSIEGLFGQVVEGEEKSILAVIERAQVIVGLPPDLGILRSSVGTRIGSKHVDYTNDEGVLSRNSDNMLSDEAKDAILQGRVKCQAVDVKYIGDPMSARCGSHEIPILVFFTVAVSRWMNARLGMDGHSGKSTQIGLLSRFGVRINLRFLADYRNIIFICLLGVSASFFRP